MKHVRALAVLILLMPNSGNTQSFEEAKQFCDLIMDRGSVLFHLAWNAFQERKMSNYIIEGRKLVNEIPVTEENRPVWAWAESLYLMAWNATVEGTLDGKSFEAARSEFIDAGRRTCLDRQLIE